MKFWYGISYETLVYQYLNSWISDRITDPDSSNETLQVEIPPSKAIVLMREYFGESADGSREMLAARDEISQP